MMTTTYFINTVPSMSHGFVNSSTMNGSAFHGNGYKNGAKLLPYFLCSGSFDIQEIVT